MADLFQYLPNAENRPPESATDLPLEHTACASSRPDGERSGSKSANTTSADPIVAGPDPTLGDGLEIGWHVDPTTRRAGDGTISSRAVRALSVAD